MLRVSKPFQSRKCVISLYCAYVRSILEYCSSIWNPSYLIYKNMLERLQRKFLHHMNYRFRASLFTPLEMMTLEKRRQLLDMLLLYDICHGSIDCPTLITKTLALRTPTTRTRHTPLFYTASVHTNYAQNSISCRLPRMFNNNFRELDIFHSSKPSFKKSIMSCLRS